MAEFEFKQAEAFEKNSSEHKEEGENLIKCLSIEKGSKVLHLGCATGQLTKIIADLVGPTGKASCNFCQFCAAHITQLNNYPRLSFDASFPASESELYSSGQY